MPVEIRMMALVLAFVQVVHAKEAHVNVCDVSLHGAVGDGKSDNTPLLQSLIDNVTMCDELYFPSENVYVSGSLFLRSNLVVTIDGTLLASPDYKNKEIWPMIYTRYEGFMRMMTASLINGGRCMNMKPGWIEYPPYIHGDQCAEGADGWNKLQNVTIRGSGTVDGNGAESGFTHDLLYTAFRPTLLGLTWIQGLTLTDLNIVNPTFWTVHVLFCKGVYISRLHIDSVDPVPIHNGDGIDADSSSNVFIQDCNINTNDDVIAIKSGKNEDGRNVGIPSNNVTVVNMEFERGHGVSIGSEMSGNVSNVLISNIHCNGTGAAVKIKSERGRGGVIENVIFENMSLVNVSQAIIIQQHYDGDHAVGEAPTFKNITLRNITALDSTVGHVGQVDCLLLGERCLDVHFQRVNLAQAQNQTWAPCAGVISGSQQDVLPRIPCVPVSKIETS
jgi:polygalacturonase